MRAKKKKKRRIIAILNILVNLLEPRLPSRVLQLMPHQTTNGVSTAPH
jgi:hypothetical protein